MAGAEARFNPTSEMEERGAMWLEGTWLRTVRADRSFFDGAFLDFLEERALPYVVVAWLTETRQRERH